MPVLVVLRRVQAVAPDEEREQRKRSEVPTKRRVSGLPTAAAGAGRAARVRL